MTAKPRSPRNLAAAGRSLWRSVVDTYELRPDELLLLEKACRTADESARLDEETRTAPLMVTGSTGQQRHNPLLNEARQTRALLGALLKQLALPDEESRHAATAHNNSARAMTAARARWQTGTCHGA